VIRICRNTHNQHEQHEVVLQMTAKNCSKNCKSCICCYFLVLRCFLCHFKGHSHLCKLQREKLKPHLAWWKPMVQFCYWWVFECTEIWPGLERILAWESRAGFWNFFSFVLDKIDKTDCDLSFISKFTRYRLLVVWSWVRFEKEPWYKNTYSPYCSPYISCGTSKKNLSKYQDILSLVITFFTLITWLFEQVVMNLHSCEIGRF